MQDRLRELFTYDDGKLLWKVKKAIRTKIGEEAGTQKADGYRAIKVDDKSYQTHRLIWIYHNGAIPDGMQIDHIDRDNTNNQLENLRLATNTENQWNRDVVGTDLNGGSYRARIGYKGKSIFLGRFPTKEKAMEVYNKKKVELHTVWTDEVVSAYEAQMAEQEAEMEAQG